MDNNIPIKVYNKEGKTKLSVRYSKVTKTISIYKYNGENVGIHHFTIELREEMDRLLLDYYEQKYNTARLNFKSPISPWHAYYEMIIEIDGVVVEQVSISKNTIEHYEVVGDMEQIKTTINLESRNQYENRTKFFKGEKYNVEFKNGEFQKIDFRIKENKINEYLKTLQNG